MWKPIVFSICSVLIAIVVICWIAGAFPSDHRQARILMQPSEPTTAPTTVDDNISVYFSPFR